jgi:hypothetical protein
MAKRFLDLKTVQPLQREQPHSVEMAVTASARVGEVHAHITGESPSGSEGLCRPCHGINYNFATSFFGSNSSNFDNFATFGIGGKTSFDGRIYEEHCLCRHDNGVFSRRIR